MTLHVTNERDKLTVRFTQVDEPMEPEGTETVLTVERDGLFFRISFPQDALLFPSEIIELARYLHNFAVRKEQDDRP